LAKGEEMTPQQWHIISAVTALLWGILVSIGLLNAKKLTDPWRLFFWIFAVSMIAFQAGRAVEHL
jgi:hypothetical protein